MIATRLAVVAATVSVLCGCAQQPARVSDEPVHLRVIAINDFHGNLQSTNLSLNLPDPRQPGRTVRVDLGGADALAGTVGALRTGVPYSVVVSSGDMFGAAPLVSTLFRHESTVEVMNRVGVDIATPGNHEFDHGPAELTRMYAGGCAAVAADAAVASCALHPYAGAKFAVISSNIETAPGTTFLPAAVVRSYGPVKVGFIGADTRTTPSIVSAGMVDGLTFTDEADAINRVAAQLRREGVNAIIVTMHEGAEIGTPQKPADWNDETCPQVRGDGWEIARRLSPDVSLILSAHTHQGYRCVIDGRPFVQAYAFGRGVSVADLYIDPKTGAVDRARTLSRNLPVFNAQSDAAARAAITAAEPAPYAAALGRAVPSAEVAALVAPYVQAAAPRVERPVGRIGGSFDRHGQTDSSAGRLLADAQLAATRAPAKGGAQIAFMNPGGVRADLPCKGTPPCTVTYGDAFSMQPFGNTLVVMTLSGRELKEMLESQQRPGRVSASILSPSAGLAYRWRSSAPAGHRVEDLRLDGKPIDPAADYRITVNNFMADGGDSYEHLRTGRDRRAGGDDLDALFGILGSVPQPVTTPRVTWVD